MSWLNYTDDEVTRFHPEFHAVADDVLRSMGKTSGYHWEHHLHAIGGGIIPDFVLVDTKTNRWVLIVEIKRTRSSVYSMRNQIQAKGYAEASRMLYPINRPQYFCVTNFEATLLFALNGTNPPKDCRIKDMDFDSGTFASISTESHKEKFASHLTEIVEYVLTTETPTFESVWPRLARTMVERAAGIQYDSIFDLNRTAMPSIVSNYFTGGNVETAKQGLLLRCLTAEYLRGILARFGHRHASRVPSMQRDVKKVANIIEALRTIDFAGIFEEDAATMYRGLDSNTSVKDGIERYIEDLLLERVNVQAQTRGDAFEFPEVLISEIYPIEIQDRRGKAQTDPDLAFLLAALTIEAPSAVVLDPGCGDGNLLSAAYDVLKAMAASHSDALNNLVGMDADALATKIASLRLVMKEPYVLAPTDPNRIYCGDMFSSPFIFDGVDVVLMNPPFKRYEAQDEAPIPAELRRHYRSSIERLTGKAETDVGQANIYNLYVEYVVKASGAGTVYGIILDNRWYHNEASKSLRTLLLRECELIAIVEYPHNAYFKDWTIATSILVARKRQPRQSHNVQFIRTNDPRRVDFNTISDAVRGNTSFPPDWRVNPVPQSHLDSGSWKESFSKALTNEFRDPSWPNLDALFTYSRSGRLEREGGGIEVYDFPFKRTSYGPKRRAAPAPRGRYVTLKSRDLTSLEEETLCKAAESLPRRFRGYAIKNSDCLNSYKLSKSDVMHDMTLETPMQRSPKMRQTYFSGKRRKWDKWLDKAVAQIKADPGASNYVDLVKHVIGLDNTVLSNEELWSVLREPYAGELVIPRKLRVGHRVHINPFAYDQTGRQVRLSSNFFSYGGCIAVDPATGLDRQTAVELISAFLMSSFGQLQFELEAYNREGARSIEGHQLSRIKIFDPRWIRPANRGKILSAAARLPYPVPTDRPPYAQPELMALDELFADEIVHTTPSLNPAELINEVQQMLFDWLEVRQP